MIQTAFNGLCMAIADSVPGVSGGTIAFILGFMIGLLKRCMICLAKAGKTENQLLFIFLNWVWDGPRVWVYVRCFYPIFLQNIFIL